MTKFETLKSLFTWSWTTVFVGWRGAGVYSPWPDDWECFPPLITEAEILALCEECVVGEELRLEVVSLIEELSADTRSRTSILESLAPLCGSLEVDKFNIEMRKWRCACVKQQLDKSGEDMNAVAKIRAIEELFVEFGALEGTPKEMQENTWGMEPSVHYEESRCEARVIECRKWLDTEIVSILRCADSTKVRHCDDLTKDR